MGIEGLLNIVLLVFISSNNLSGSPKVSNNSKDNTLDIYSLPYLTTMSLGDELYLEGLLVKDEDNEISFEELVFNGYDSSNLGKQMITVSYEEKHVSFDVYVTNEFVNNYIPTGSLFISEFVSLGDDELAVEIYNNSKSAISLADYNLHFKNNNEIAVIELDNKIMDVNETYVVSNFPITDINNQNIDVYAHNVSEVSLFKNNDLIDNVAFNNLEHSSRVMRRHYKVYKAATVFNEKQWIFTNDDISNIGKHEVLESVVKHNEQARAYARFVLFGAGMFAAGRVNEAFGELKKEYELMSSAAKDYFNDNKSEKVEGYDESGKYISMSFLEAHSRIALLASRSGNTSFLPIKKGLNIENKKLLFILLIIVILTLGIGIYIYSSRIRKRREQT